MDVFPLDPSHQNNFATSTNVRLEDRLSVLEKRIDNIHINILSGLDTINNTLWALNNLTGKLLTMVIRAIFVNLKSNKIKQYNHYLYSRILDKKVIRFRRQ